MSDISLAWAPGGHVLQVLARDLNADLAAPLAEIAEPGAHAVRRAGPDSWFLVGEAVLAPAEIAAKAARLAPHAWLIDQSHGRLRLRLEGPQAQRRLARGVGLDLSKLGPGASAETQYHTLALHLTRTAPDGFEILIARSFSESLWEELAK